MAIPETMRAMVLREGTSTLRLEALPVPEPGPREVLLQVLACGVCRTDLHIVDDELPRTVRPLVPGHEIVGRVVARGPNATRLDLGTRVGVPWLGGTDGTCPYCRSGRENLCDHPRFTGYTVNGGYAEYVTADERFCLELPGIYSDANAAPLLCAGLIGHRAYRLAGDDLSRVGLYGFGASAHILAQVLVTQGVKVYAFTREGDADGQAFACRLGAAWAGASIARPPALLDAALLFAPVGPLVVEALRSVRKGGTVVCAGIHMSDIPSFPYRLLWEERTIRSVANLTRQDGRDFMRLAARTRIRTHVERFGLEEANAALAALREGRIEGAAVLVPAEG
jgi:alcohol dehydrogenase, propanol-preferring